MRSPTAFTLTPGYPTIGAELILYGCRDFDSVFLATASRWVGKRAEAVANDWPLHDESPLFVYTVPKAPTPTSERDKLFFSMCVAAIFGELSMTPLKERSRKPRPRTILPQESVRSRMSKPVMCSFFFVAVVATVTAPVLADTIGTTPKGVGYATGHLGKKHFETRNESIFYGFRQTPPQGYFGNWGFAPGGSHWDPNYKWRRSLGFWDTNSPACPFRYC